jgi:hypothetical protein
MFGIRALSKHHCFLVIIFLALVAIIFLKFFPEGDLLMGREFHDQTDTKEEVTLVSGHETAFGRNLLENKYFIKVISLVYVILFSLLICFNTLVFYEAGLAVNCLQAQRC